MDVSLTERSSGDALRRRAAAPHAREAPARIRSIAVQLDGSLHVELLGRSIDQVIRRHAARRRAAPSSVDIKLVDRSGLQDAERDQEILRHASEAAEGPFDLGRGPLVRATLLRFGDETHALLLTAHSAALGDEPADSFLEELAGIYERLSAGPPSLLSDPGPEGTDPESLPKSRDPEVHLSYWREQLAFAPTALELTTDHPRAPLQGCHSAVARRELPAALVEALDELGRREGASRFVVLLAAFATLLHRYVEQDDILIGTPDLHRHKGCRGVIGRLECPLVIRVRLHEEMTFKRLLEEVSLRVAAAQAHGGVPLGELVAELDLPVDAGRHPLFQAAFDLHRRPAVVHGPELTFTELDVEDTLTEVDLSLSVRPTARGLSASLVYRPDLFDAETPERMLAHLHVLLAGVSGNHARRIPDLPLLTAEERRRMLVEWNPRDACIHEVFLARVREAPSAVAARCGDEEITYRELNRRANRLARRLMASGVGPDVPVGIFLERSIEVLVGLLGVLKAGGAYVPLDPVYPDERLDLMLKEAAVSVLLGGRDQTARLSFQGCIFSLDEDAAPTCEADDENPESGARPDHLAYVMFTSGSTGLPKGVAVPHRGVVRLVVCTNYVTIGPADRVMHAASLSFDASTFEIWGALLNGARLTMIDQETLLSPPAFAAAVRREGVTVMFLTTALFHHMVSLGTDAFAGLSLLVVGGDALDPRWAKVALEKNAPRRLINGYGPTENTTFSTFHVVRDGARVPIGRPIANTRAYVLDRSLHPVPVGIAGELYVGGDGLARGYLNRPELTAERFIKAPLPEEPGLYLYRTGDRVRYLPDGSIEFLGRIDSQVKIRGFRVEIGEVESTLAGCPVVRDAAVVLREDTPGDKRLVAYVATNLVSDRVPLYSMCRVEIDGAGVADVMTKDLSSGGIGLLDVPEGLRQGQRVRLRLQLPGAAEERWMPGIVAWRKGRRAGVRLKLTPAERALLSQSMNHAFKSQDQLKLLQGAVTGNLRALLREKLPEYMVPANIVILRSLPLSPSGKLDRRALPPPAQGQPAPELEATPMTADEERVARIWAQVLNTDRIGLRDNFFDLGGNSILAVTMLIRLEEVFQIQLSMRRLQESPTVAGVALAIEEVRRGRAPQAPPARRIDLGAEAILDADICPARSPPRDSGPPRNIFLTGATGFLGAFLLQELLLRTEARIHCLVRAPSFLEGLCRIQKILESYGLWDPGMSARIVAVPGDLARPLLGLPRGNFELLAEQIDAIYHSGAEINYVKPYASHKATNVLGTKEVLRLACLVRNKPLYHISTIGVSGHIGYFTGRKVLTEETDIDICEEHLATDMGYSQSKWVAEKLVSIARSRGADVTVFRPGFIMGHSRTGIANFNDFACRMIKGCIEMGAYPDLAEQSKEFVPVDFVSRAIVHLSRKEGSGGKVFHLVPPPSRRVDLRGFFELLRSYGYTLSKLPYRRWQHELLDQLKGGGNNPLLPLLPMLTEPVHDEALTRWELYERMPAYDCQNMLAGLRGTDIECPAMDERLLATYLACFQRSGFLPPPADTN